jgi:hypothetical protein
MLFVGPLFAQTASIGVKTGVSLTDLVRTSGEIGGHPFRADTSRFTIGPALDFRLPHGLGFEFGVVYKRFPQKAGQVQIVAEPGTPFSTTYSPYSHTGQSWEFPMLGQYRFSRERVRPYLEAGVSFIRLSGVLGPFRTLSNQSAILTPPGLSENRVGVVAGVGFEIKLPLIYVTPGLRYTHYGKAESWLPSANSVDFLVGLAF